MLALYRCGRQAEALEVYRETRTMLDQDLGLQPSGELRALGELDTGAGPRTGPGFQSDRRIGLRARPSGGSSDAARGPADRRRRRSAASCGGRCGGYRAERRQPLARRVSPNSVAVIDPHSNSVVGAVSVGTRPDGIAFGSGSMWVANADDQTVSRIDPASLQTVREHSCGRHADGYRGEPRCDMVGIGPQGKLGGCHASRPRVQLTRPRDAHRQRRPGWAGSNRRARQRGLGRPSSGLLTRLDAVTGRADHAVDPDAGPAAVDVGDGAVWVTDDQADNVARVDPTGLVTQIPVGNGPTGIAVGAGGGGSPTRSTTGSRGSIPVRALP